jgi:hypothetical protein
LTSVQKTMINQDFAIFILSHGRADRVDTYKSLQKANYTGRIYIVIDNEDKEEEKYRRNFGDKVIVFDKKAIAETFDEGDNFEDRRAVIYARNACFQIAKELNITYFMELDDDYTVFRYVLNSTGEYATNVFVKSINIILDAMIDFYKSIPAKSIAMAQGGDFIGGRDAQILQSDNRKRKCMNTFICSTERPFQFFGRINEDVNTYVEYQRRGNLFLTVIFLAINQRETQNNKGGMTDLYLDSGTYIKSFYTVMYAPSCVTITPMITQYQRLHHRINWDAAVPCILSEKYRKASTSTG